jgi:hypothetical protein
MPIDHYSDSPNLHFAPGDQVVRYMGGKPLYCTVVVVIDEMQLLIKADAWPMGYTAPVHSSQVALVSHQTPLGLSV